MATLLRGSSDDAKAEDQLSPEASATADPASSPCPSPARPRNRLIRGSLIVTDLLLFALAARLVFKANGHFGFLEIALCVIAVGMGAWLSCLALWRD